MSRRAAIGMRSVIGALACLLLAGTQLPAEAARTFAATDPAGDVIAGTHGDLVRLGLSTSGVVRRGRYLPRSLVLQLDLADAVDRSGQTSYEVDLTLPGCAGGFRATANPGVPSAQHVSCQLQPDDLTFTMDVAPTVRGHRMTWVVPFDDFPSGALSAGQVARRIRAFTALSERALPGEGTAPALHDDDLTTSAAYALR